MNLYMVVEVSDDIDTKTTDPRELAEEILFDYTSSRTVTLVAAEWTLGTAAEAIDAAVERGDFMFNRNAGGGDEGGSDGNG